jgi:hypothetical protein
VEKSQSELRLGPGQGSRSGRPTPRLGPIITTSTSTTITTASDTITERRMENAAEGLSSHCFNLLHRMLPANKENVVTICDYVSSLKSEINPSNNCRRDIIILLCTFSTFVKNANAKSKHFNDVTREDILSFLESLRKIESVDPLHKWIGT